MKRWLCSWFLLASAVLLPAQTKLRPEIEKLLPPAECQVDVMGVVFPKRFQELNVKMQAALAANKEWLFNYIKQNAKPGEPLPYDEKMGLTKSEYSELLALDGKKEMQKFGSAELTVTTNWGIFQFHCSSDLPDLDGVRINLEDLTLTTPFGALTNPAPDISEGGGVIGPFSGYRWQLETGDADSSNVTTASFLVGRAKNTGRNFIYYRGAIVRARNAVKNTTVLIFYDQPKS